MKNNPVKKARDWAIKKLGGLTWEDTAFLNASRPYTVKQYEKVPVKLAAYCFVDEKMPESVKDFYLRRAIERIGEEIYKQKIYKLRELEGNPNSIDGKQIEITVEILPPVDGW